MCTARVDSIAQIGYVLAYHNQILIDSVTNTVHPPQIIQLCGTAVSHTCSRQPGCLQAAAGIDRFGSRAVGNCPLPGRMPHSEHNTWLPLICLPANLGTLFVLHVSMERPGDSFLEMQMGFSSTARRRDSSPPDSPSSGCLRSSGCHSLVFLLPSCSQDHTPSWIAEITQCKRF